MLQTLGGFSAAGETTGGVLHSIGLAKQWTACGHEVHYMTTKEDKGDSQYDGGYYLHRLPSFALPYQPLDLSFALSLLLNHFVQRKAITRLVEDRLERPSMVLALSPYPSDVLAAFNLHRLLGVPGAIYFHHLNPPPWWQPFRRGSLLRATMNWLLAVLALSLAKLGGLLPVLDQPSELNRAGWRFNAAVRDSHFLDADYVTEPRTEPPIFAGCFIGRVTPSKGALDLLHVWQNVTRQIPGAKLVIAGKCYSSRFEAQLKRTMKRLGLLDSVEYRGYLSAQEKERLLAQSSLFVYPSYEEGWSLGVMEAAYHGVVPILYDLPAYDYLPYNEIKAPAGDVRSFAKLVVDLLRDPDRVVLLAEQLRLTVAAYQKQVIAESQAALFERLSRNNPQITTSARDS